MAKLYHPDVNESPDAHAKFVLINQAYEVLMDRQKRVVYDEKIKTTADPYYSYTRWAEEQLEKEREEAQKRQEEFLKRKEKIRQSKMYYPYLAVLYISTGVLLSTAVLILVACVVAIVWYHVFMFFFMLPFICLAAVVLKITLVEYKKYRALF